MRVTHLDRSLVHEIQLFVECLNAAKQGVDASPEAELALGGGIEIAGGGDEQSRSVGAVDQVHALTLSASTDTAGGYGVWRARRTPVSDLVDSLES